MITRLLMFIIASIFMIWGFTFIIIYTNLFTFGYTIKEYILFIFKRIECLIFILSFIFNIYIIYTWEGIKK